MIALLCKLACDVPGHSVSADERKKRPSNENVSGGKMVGREKGRACKHLYKYHSPPSSRKTFSLVKMTKF